MILSHQVKTIAETHLRRVLAHYAARMNFLFQPALFDRWCRLCAERCNQLDIAGYVTSREALVLFIQGAARTYADHQLRRIGENPLALVKSDVDDTIA